MTVDILSVELSLLSLLLLQTTVSFFIQEIVFLSIEVGCNAPPLRPRPSLDKETTVQ